MDGTAVTIVLDRPIDVTVLDKVMNNQLSESDARAGLQKTRRTQAARRAASLYAGQSNFDPVGDAALFAGPDDQPNRGHVQLSLENERLTPGGLVQMWHRLADLLLVWYEQIHRESLASGKLHADETGWQKQLLQSQ